jgi:peptidoglycan/LPS O-acetylase OafA/YrhL
MGILRYFLAITVLFAHTPIAATEFKPFNGNGGVAVQAFFVISGFYMSLVFEKYQLQSLTWSHIKNFYITRALRIYPVYYICLATIVVLILHGITPPQPYHNPHEAMALIKHTLSKFFYFSENLFIFGQSLMRFFNFDTANGNFIFQPMIWPLTAGAMGCGFTLMGQAWTLSPRTQFLSISAIYSASSGKCHFSNMHLSLRIKDDHVSPWL